MNCISRAIALGALLLAGGHVAAAQADALRLFKPTGAESFHNVRYLNDERYTGNSGARRDAEIVMDIHVPKGKGNGPFPVLLTVHGGAWVAGCKEGQLFEHFMQTALDHGYATVGLNYLLRPKEILPQVFYDTQDAVRFLRKESARYHLDPTRVGAVGWSAGGWLVSHLGIVGGDAVVGGTQGIGASLGDFAAGIKGGGKPWIMPSKLAPGLVFPAWSPTPAWPEYSGQVQAISYDFSFWHGLAYPGSAAINQWAGAGHHHRGQPAVEAVGVTYDYSVLADAGWNGKQVHCPPMTSACVSATGSGTVTLSERVIQFFDRQFGPEGRAPTPEIRPFLRIITGPVDVSIIVPAPTMQVHYTTDGSEPTTSSPVYGGPFRISGPTVVKALATIPDRKPSGVAIATFLSGPLVPQITAPTASALPVGAVGKPYEVRFSSDAASPVQWRLAGEIVPRKLDLRDRQAPLVDVMGLSLDAATGVLSGTPKIGGTFWVQVQVGLGTGQLGSVRNYLLTITGTGADLPEVAAGADTNTEVARLKGWPQAKVDALLAALTQANCNPVAQPNDDEVLLLVEQVDAAKAKPLVQAFAQQHGLRLGDQP